MERSEMVQEYLKSLSLQDRELDFDLLSNVVSQHVSTYAFSSVRCWLGDDLHLDFESLYHRIVVKRLGGYCFGWSALLDMVHTALVTRWPSSSTLSMELPLGTTRPV